MSINKVVLQEKLSLIHEYWHPHIVGKLNGQLIKLVKMKGEFVWHMHEHEDECFQVLKGSFDMHLRDKVITLHEGDIIVIPKTVEHKPVAEEECHIMLFEPDTVLNTGNATESELTRNDLLEI